MDGGMLTLCLKCADLESSRRFYETLGMEVVEEHDTHLIMKNGNSRVALMTFLDCNCLNFRGADAFALHDAYVQAGFDLPGEPESYEAEKYNATANGTSWSTYDPDGNHVLFDTNEAEVSDEGREARIRSLLEDTARDLANLGASDACRQAFREEILKKFGG